MQEDKGGEGSSSVEVLYEDEALLVANKPSGMMVHNDGRSREPTLVDWFLHRVPEALGVGEGGTAQDGTPLERSGIVHRLDQETSGVIVFAKDQETFEYLKGEFQAHSIKKEYRTFVYGTMKERWGSIDRPIGRSTRDFRLRSAQRGARGLLREAHTDWECISQSDTHAYLKIFPKTGRTHQIRVHMKAISRPIVQDALYAPDIQRGGDNLGFERLALHAHRLTFTLPGGKRETFEAPLPPDFEKAEKLVANA